MLSGSEKETSMPDRSKPNICVVLKTGRNAEPDAPMLGFVRWRLVPLPAPAVEADVREDEATSKRTP